METPQEGKKTRMTDLAAIKYSCVVSYSLSPYLSILHHTYSGYFYHVVYPVAYPVG